MLQKLTLWLREDNVHSSIAQPTTTLYLVIISCHVIDVWLLLPTNYHEMSMMWCICVVAGPTEMRPTLHLHYSFLSFVVIATPMNGTTKNATEKYQK